MPRDPEAGDDTDYASLPRPQRGSESQITLITLLANYWLHAPAAIPSAAIVDLLEDFGVTNASARTTLSRLSRRGVLTAEREGRRTFYRLSEPATNLLRRRTAELLAFGTEHPWDGMWTCVAFSVPNERRHIRHPLRAALRELGFAGMYDGLWISPNPPGEALGRALTELSEVGSVTVLRASIESSDGVDPIDAFDHEAVRGAYDDFLTRFEPVRTSLASGDVTTKSALVDRTLLTNTWRHLNRLDPDLPASLLPSDWPRSRAHDVFVAVYDGLAPLAAARFEHVVGSHDAKLRGQLRTFTTGHPPGPA